MGGKQKSKGGSSRPRPSQNRAALWIKKKTREAEERAEKRRNQRRLDKLVQESRRQRSLSASDASDTSDSETDDERSAKKKRRDKRRDKRRKSGDRVIKVNLDALAATHVAEGFHVIIQVMPRAPEAEPEPEPEAEAAVAEPAREQEGAEEVEPKGNYSEAEILEWMRLELTHADRIYDLKRLPNILPTLPQVVHTTALAKRCADVYFTGDQGLEQLRTLVDEFQLQVCSRRWPSLILTNILQIIATRGIEVHETLVGITL